MNKTLATLIAASATCLCLGAHAADDTTTPPLDHAQAKSAEKHSDAKYKADKKKADANEDLNKANCDSSLTKEGRACKDDAKAEAKKEKADAKVHKVNKDNAIDAQTK